MRTSSFNNTSSRRAKVLQDLATAATSRPLDRSAITKAREAVKTMLGEEAVVETAGVIGLFECFTKFVDATGKSANPPDFHKKLTWDLSRVNILQNFWSFLF